MRAEVHHPVDVNDITETGSQYSEHVSESRFETEPYRMRGRCAIRAYR
jgi:hypothetical protein